MDFNVYFSDRRKSLGYSQKDISEKLGISVPTVSNWENKNRYPDLFILGELAKLLEVDLESLLACKNEKKNNFDQENSFSYENFSTYLKRLRRSKNITLTELAEKLNISYQTISKWETQKSLPHIDTFIKLCEILDEPIIEVYYGKKLIEEKPYVAPPNKQKFIERYKFNFLVLFLLIFSAICLALAFIFAFVPLKNNSIPDNSSEDSALSIIYPETILTIDSKIELFEENI